MEIIRKKHKALNWASQRQAKHGSCPGNAREKLVTLCVPGMWVKSRSGRAALSGTSAPSSQGRSSSLALTKASLDSAPERRYSAALGRAELIHWCGGIRSKTSLHAKPRARTLGRKHLTPQGKSGLSPRLLKASDSRRRAFVQGMDWNSCLGREA